MPSKSDSAWRTAAALTAAARGHCCGARHTPMAALSSSVLEPSGLLPALHGPGTDAHRPPAWTRTAPAPTRTAPGTDAPLT